MRARWPTVFSIVDVDVPIINIDRGSNRESTQRYGYMPTVPWIHPWISLINIDHEYGTRYAPYAARRRERSRPMASVNGVPWEANLVVCLPSMIAVNYNTTRLFVCQLHIHTR